MLSLRKHLANARANCLNQSQPFVVFKNNYSSSISVAATLSSASPSPSPSHVINNNSSTSSGCCINSLARSTAEDAIMLSLKAWFRSRDNSIFDQIFAILGNDDTSDRSSTDLALSNLGFRLSEAFVLDVLSYGRDKDLFSCLKFFDWAGRQPRFHHTRVTFNAIFKILSRTNHVEVVLSFLEAYSKQGYVHKARFYDTLVMGYSAAGKPGVALQLLAGMRYKGIDLDQFGYHVLLNALIEEDCFDAVEAIAKQIQMRGFEDEVTCNLMVKYFCNKKQFDEAEAYLRGLMAKCRHFYRHALSILVDALCEIRKFKRAEKLIEEFGHSGIFTIQQAYNSLLKHLLNAGRLKEALEFLKNKKSLDEHVMTVCSYNMVISRLLRNNLFEEICDLLIEMQENQIIPDKVTINILLCYFCKVGMVDIAINLYNLSSQLGFSHDQTTVYNYLSSTLHGNGSIDEAYRLLQNSTNQGYFSDRKSFSILVDALCVEGELNKMKKLIACGSKSQVFPSESAYNKIISTLCRGRMVEDGYIVYEDLIKRNGVAKKATYRNLIFGFVSSNRCDDAVGLLIEMQEKGHKPTANLFRAVIGCLCGTENSEKKFFHFMEMQLSRCVSNSQTYNLFIDGAGHAKQPELARKAYEMMRENGIEPILKSHILMLKSYLKNDNIWHALNFFSVLREEKKIKRKLYNTMVVGLCEAKNYDIALDFLREMKEEKVVPSIQCYQLLIKLLCSEKRYESVMRLVNELERANRRITPFIGNMLLLQSLRSRDLYRAMVRLRRDEKLGSWMVGLVRLFSGRIRVSEHVDILEEEIGSCFQLNVYTYNMILRRVSWEDMDLALELFYRMCQKGYEPNQWTYSILVHGFLEHGRIADAERFSEEMHGKGLLPLKGIRKESSF